VRPDCSRMLQYRTLRTRNSHIPVARGGLLLSRDAAANGPQSRQVRVSVRRPEVPGRTVGRLPTAGPPCDASSDKLDVLHAGRELPARADALQPPSARGTGSGATSPRGPTRCSPLVPGGQVPERHPDAGPERRPVGLHGLAAVEREIPPVHVRRERRAQHAPQRVRLRARRGAAEEG
jgi:hypothetical protein